jgi:hypothetical protein
VNALFVIISEFNVQSTNSWCKEIVGVNYPTMLLLLTIMYKRGLRGGGLFHSNILINVVSLFILEMCVVPNTFVVY